MEMVLEQVCASCGNRRLPDGRFCLFCGDLLAEPASPAVVAKANSNTVTNPPDTTEYAGFWLRVWAGAVDICIEALGALVLTLAIDFVLRRFGRGFGIDPWNSKVFTGVCFIVILAVGSWLYSAFFESSAWRATLGKRLLGLQVITSDGDRVSFGKATERHLMKFLSLFCLTIGFMMSGWTKRRQALHDMPCDCLVIRVPVKSFTLLRR
ncbi:MAG: RDD family protein [Candidatus Korobacteraceae bacterium]|jgi:uncharacterized RDD family membrane protein YckC